MKCLCALAGGGQGIGRAFAHALGEAGAAVAVVDVVRGTAEATAAELAGKGIRSVAVVADITRAKDCERCGAAVIDVEIGGRVASDAACLLCLRLQQLPTAWLRVLGRVDDDALYNHACIL